MADQSIVAVNTAADTFQIWINRTNALINALATETVTVASNTLGAQTAGNGFVTGILGANILAANTLQGGNVGSLSNLAIISNANFTANVSVTGLVAIGNSIANVTSNSIHLSVVNATARANLTPIGLVVGQTTINATSVFVGNSTVNLTANASFLRLGNSTANTVLNATAIALGGVNTALVTNRTAIAENSTSTFAASRANFIAGNNIFLAVTNDSGGGQVNVQIDAVAISGSAIIGGSNTMIQFNDSTNFNGWVGFTFDKATNTMNVGNTITIGANVSANTTLLKIGNTTVNTVINSTAVALSGVNAAIITNRTAVAENSTSTFTRSRLNFIQGTNITLSVSDHSAGGQVNVEIAAATSVGGSNTYVQFNDSTAMGATAGFTFNKATNTVFVGNTILVGANVTVNTTLITVGTSVVNSTTVTSRDQVYTNGSILVSGFNITIASALANTIDSFAIATYRAAEYFYTVKDETANNYHTGKLIALSDGTNGRIAEYGILVSNTDLGFFTATQNSTHVLVNFTPTSVSTTLKGLRTLIPV